MKSLSPLKLTFTALLLSSGMAQALPTLINNCKIKVLHPVGAQDLYFDENCQTAYVSPPSFGRFVVKEIEVLPAIAECTDLSRLQQEIIDSSDISKKLELLKNYEKLAGKQGSLVSFEYQNRWTEMVEAYQQLNASLNLKFERLPLSQYSLYTVLKTTEVENSSDSLMFSTVDAESETAGDTAGGAYKNADKVRGTFGLSLAGSCPFLDKDGVKEGMNANNLSAYAVANFAYTFETLERVGAAQTMTMGAGGTYITK